MKECRLCQLKKELIKKSHIYPDFLYKDLFDAKHKLIRVTTEEIIKKNPRISRPSTGVYEGGLLCRECENDIINGNYETYVADIIFGKNRDVKCRNEKNNEVEAITVQNLDYKKIKNFLLSILFRADICTFEEFDDVNLGPYHEKIRKIVHENIETSDLDFQINILKLEPDSNFNQLIVQPFRNKTESETMYSFLLKDYLCVISFKENKTSKKMKGNRLKQNGEIIIPIIPKSVELNFILKYLNLE